MTELEIKATVRQRDGYRCVDCGRTQDECAGRFVRLLDTHRLVPGSPYTPTGTVSLCRRCHKRRHAPPKLPAKLAFDLEPEVAVAARIAAAVARSSVSRFLTAFLRREFAEEIAALHSPASGGSTPLARK